MAGEEGFPTSGRKSLKSLALLIKCHGFVSHLSPVALTFYNNFAMHQRSSQGDILTAATVGRFLLKSSTLRGILHKTRGEVGILLSVLDVGVAE